MIGTEELYMDCIFHELRTLYSQIEMKVSEPFVCFAKTVVGASSVMCTGETPNHKDTMKVI